MKTLNTIMLALGVAALCATGLQAQTAVANIPFEFTVQNTTLPAGAYSLAPLNQTSGVVEIMNSDTGKAIAVLTMPSDRTRPQTPKIVFHVYGDRYFLSEIRTPNGRQGYVKPSRTERELQASSGLQMASLAVPLGAQ